MFMASTDRVQFSEDQKSLSFPEIGERHILMHAELLLGTLSPGLQQPNHYTVFTLLWYCCNILVVSTSCVFCDMCTARDGAVLSSSMRMIATFSVISLSLSSFVLLNSNGLLFLLLLAVMFEITHQQWVAVLILIGRNI
jgi:hypothetical protein